MWYNMAMQKYKHSLKFIFIIAAVIILAIFSFMFFSPVIKAF